MKVKEKKTVRFDALVKKSGQPEQATLWSKPEDDRAFMAAVKAHRVVTVVQHNLGTKKDFGLVGFFPKEKAAFFVFPKVIHEVNETKVVGIKYDRIAESTPKGPLHKTRATMKVKAPKPKPSPPKPKLFTFRTTVELTARQSESIEVQARSSSEAATLIKARTSETAFDPKKSTIIRTTGKITRSN